MNGAAWHWVACMEKRPSRRTDADLDVILAKMKTMMVFEGYPEHVLQELSRFVYYETYLANTTLFRPGEEGLYWYVVLSGSLDMMNVSTKDPKKTNLICQLRSGNSFGEDVVTGGTRQTMVVTKEYSELLYVEAENIRYIYETHRNVMEKLLPPPPSVTREDVDSEGMVAEEECPLSELAIAGLTLYQLIATQFSNLLSDCRVNMYTYRRCCSGKDLVDWVLAHSSTLRTRQQVAQMWQALLVEGVLQHVLSVHPFMDDPQLYYRFVDLRPKSAPVHSSKLQQFMSLFSFSRQSYPGQLSNSPAQPNKEDPLLPAHWALGCGGRIKSISFVESDMSTSRSSVGSTLEECFDTISQLGPEVLIYSILNKDPSERTEEDRNVIYEELLNVRALRHLTNAVKKQVAACVKLEHHRKAGKFLFHQGERGDSWYVVLKGSVNVVIKGKGVVCTLHEGDDFGKLSLLTEGERSVSIQSREPNSYFLKIERDDFRRILLSVESSTMKVMDRGKEVMQLQRENMGSYVVIKGTPDRMLDHLISCDIDENQEDSFAHDFFLTHPAFISIPDMCKGLLARFMQKEEGVEEDVNVTRKKRISRAIVVWIRTAQSQLVKDPAFLKLLREVQDGLEEGGVPEELDVINTALSESITRAALGKNTPSPILGGLLGKGKSKGGIPDGPIILGIRSISPAQPQDMVHTRVHTLDHTCCRLTVRHDAKVTSIRDEACHKLKLPQFKYQLCEVKSSGEKVVLKENDVSISSRLSVNGRLFLVQRSHKERTVPPLSDQIQKPMSPFPDDATREIAAHLTVYDWNLFSNIQVMEFVYQIFGRHKFNKIVTNLDMLLRRFNEVQYWVVTSLCNESDLTKRVALLKKFIKIAGYCKDDNNLNSFLAIIVGLMNGAVTRMKQTWSEIPPKVKRRFDTYEAIMDPSRNHHILRAYQSKLPPPVIPFMPLVMKDAFFLHEGNETLIGGLVNFEKMRLVATKVRSLFDHRKGVLSSDICLLANKNAELQKYIRNFHVVDDQHALAQLSHKVEPMIMPPSTT